MAGTFDELIRQSMSMSQRGDPQQQARDVAARRMNNSGGASTAMAPPSAAREPQGNGATHSNPQLPAQGPIPPTRASLTDIVAAQLAASDGVPYEPGGGYMPEQVAFAPGGSDVGAPQTAFAPGGSMIDEAIAATDPTVFAPGNTPQMGSGAPVPQAAPQQVVEADNSGIGATEAVLGGLLAAGGAGGIYALIQKYRMGDPNATAQLDQLAKTSGMPVDQLAALAEQPVPPGDTAKGMGTPVAGGTQPNAAKPKAAAKSAPSNKGKAAEKDAGTKPRNWTQGDDISYPGQAQKPAWMDNKPKSKTKPKAKVKVK